MKRTKYIRLIFFAALILPIISIANVLAFDLDPGGSGGSDTTPPTVTFSSPVTSQVYGRTVTVSWSGYDASGVSKYYVKVNGGSWILKNLATSHTFYSLTPGVRTFYVKAYDTKNNYGVTSRVGSVLAGGEYYVHLQSSHKTVFYPGLDPEAYATITIDYKIWFTFTESTRKVTYTDVEYLTQVSYQNSDNYPILGRANPTLYDAYCTWVYSSYYGEVHTPSEPSMILVTGNLGFERDFDRDISSEGWYNNNRFYAGLNYYCGILVNVEIWEIQCKIKCDGSPLYNLQSSTYTPGPPGGSGIEWNDYLLYSYCTLYEV